MSDFKIYLQERIAYLGHQHQNYKQLENGTEDRMLAMAYNSLAASTQDMKYELEGILEKYEASNNELRPVLVAAGDELTFIIRNNDPLKATDQLTETISRCRAAANPNS